MTSRLQRLCRDNLRFYSIHILCHRDKKDRRDVFDHNLVCVVKYFRAWKHSESDFGPKCFNALKQIIHHTNQSKLATRFEKSADGMTNAIYQEKSRLASGKCLSKSPCMIHISILLPYILHLKGKLLQMHMQ